MIEFVFVNGMIMDSLNDLNSMWQQIGRQPGDLFVDTTTVKPEAASQGTPKPDRGTYIDFEMVP